MTMYNSIASFRGFIFKLKCKVFSRKIFIKKGLRLFKKIKIEGPGKVYIGENCRINGIKGDSSKYVTIDTHNKNAIISLGDNVSLYAARISSNYKIDIGNNVLIEETGVVDTDFHSIDKERGDPLGEDLSRCQINIGNNVSIGAYSVVTKGVNIGDNVIVVPGSVVTRSINSGSLVSGNPARAIKN